MKGRKDCRAAAIEARQEAGLIGRIHQRSLGSYTYWKRKPGGFVYCRVRVFVLEVISQLVDWREKGERKESWMLVEDAAEMISDPGLVPLIRNLPASMPRKRKRGRKP